MRGNHLSQRHTRASNAANRLCAALSCSEWGLPEKAITEHSLCALTAHFHPYRMYSFRYRKERLKKHILAVYMRRLFSVTLSVNYYVPRHCMTLYRHSIRMESGLSSYTIIMHNFIRDCPAVDGSKLSKTSILLQ